VLDISYIGLVKILTDAGAVKNVFADVIFQNDHFIYSQGSSPMIEHKPDLLRDRGPMIGAYAIAYFRDGGFQFEVMAKPEIEKVRATSESWKAEATRQYSPWETWTNDMWKKTVVKHLYKMLPKTKFSEQLVAALSKEHENEIADTVEQNERMQDIFEEIQEPETVVEPVKEKVQVKDKKKEDEAFDAVQQELKEESEKK